MMYPHCHLPKNVTTTTQTEIECMIAEMDNADIHGGTGEESDIEGDEVEQHDVVGAKEKKTYSRRRDYDRRR
jgi:hypothetical protein